jgi:hypothetical protein
VATFCEHSHFGSKDDRRRIKVLLNNALTKEKDSDDPKNWKCSRDKCNEIVSSFIVAAGRAHLSSVKAKRYCSVKHLIEDLYETTASHWKTFVLSL